MTKKLIELYEHFKISSSKIEKILIDKGVVEEPDFDKLSKEEVRDICLLIGRQEEQLQIMMELQDYFKENNIKFITSVSADDFLAMNFKR